MSGDDPTLSQLVLAVGDDGWSPQLFDVVRRVVIGTAKRERIRCPEYVGIEGRRWTEAAVRQASEEFYIDCVFAKLAALRALAAGQGLGIAYLARACRNWLVDRQRARDPIRTANFGALRSGVESAIKSGLLACTDPTRSRIGKGSELHFAGSAPGCRTWGERELAGVARAMPAWQSLRTRLRSRGTDTPPEFGALLVALRSAGCPAFVFGDLLDVLHELAGVGAAGRLATTDVLADLAAAPTVAIDESGDFTRAVRLELDRSVASGQRRDLLHALLDEYVSLTSDASGERLNRAEFGARHGLSRQRASDLGKQLEEIVGRAVVAREAREGGGHL